jgi:hypothetical protein
MRAYSTLKMVVFVVGCEKGGASLFSVNKAPFDTGYNSLLLIYINVLIGNDL